MHDEEVKQRIRMAITTVEYAKRLTEASLDNLKQILEGLEESKPQTLETIMERVQNGEDVVIT